MSDPDSASGAFEDSRLVAPGDDTENGYRRQMLVRLQHTATEMGVMAVAGSLLVLVARLLVPAPEYVWLRLALLPLTGLFAYAITRASTVRSYGLACMATIVTVTLNSYLGVLGTERPLLYFLPGALLIALSTSFFWITLGQWICGTLACYVFFLPFVFDPSASRPDTVFSLVFALTAVATGFVSHQRIQDFQRRAFEQERRLSDLAVSDTLTGARSRAEFLRRAERAAARAQANGSPLLLLYLDIDHFKLLNDSHGHAAGDAVLRATALVLQGALRRQDVLGRLGGEEFCVLLPDCDEDQALALAERLRPLLAAVPRPDGRLTVSSGIARLLDGESVRQALNRADLAMLAAKQAGRDTVRLAP